jgi:hypothetical protein
LSFVLLHSIFVSIHAASASICLISGLALIKSPINRHANRRWLLNIFVYTFPVFLFSLYLAIGFGWNLFAFPLAIGFLGLSVLDIFMVLRAYMAYSVFKSKPSSWQVKFIGHVGFNIISLFAGFFIVLAIVLGSPIWLVIIVAILSIGLGILGVNRVEHREKVVLKQSTGLK